MNTPAKIAFGKLFNGALALAAAGFLAAPHAQATVLFNVNFHGMTAGELPTTAAATAGGTTTKVSYAFPASGDSSVNAWVQNGYTDSVTENEFSADQVVVLTDTVTTGDPDDANIHLVLNNADKISTTSTNKVVNLSWDIMVGSVYTGNGYSFVDLRTGYFGDKFGVLVIQSSSGSAKITTLGDSLDHSVGAFSLGVSHSVLMTLNYTTSQISYSLDGGTAYTFTFDNSKEFGALDFTTGSTSGSQMALTNIKIETVPEPATWALLAGAGTFLMAFRRRRA